MLEMEKKEKQWLVATASDTMLPPNNISTDLHSSYNRRIFRRHWKLRHILKDLQRKVSETAEHIFKYRTPLLTHDKKRHRRRVRTICFKISRQWLDIDNANEWYMQPLMHTIREKHSSRWYPLSNNVNIDQDN